ncbi:MAG TPA: protein kinase [Thiobacillus sp.]|nr:MAG: serine/threonine protein kinase [Hydrogenophilales bacterium 28-61-11]OYZ57614.1 MAG: serine/threonine protein kinase [Hydrogenophilales bacterium 16-61-112]OZA42957.1 MAG: serine/threonine protein kinase [Hydrogenophilales bacterium 17-61-76]HQT31959.1 protein kinase [Thiobacillus sp.]HQT71570.1 protein kinase [Thiobacillus sp.]
MTIGRYEILDEIGQGAMGTVYRARDPMIERVVAIKTVSIALLQQEGADAEARFLREAQSAGRLSHPNIVTIYDVSEADGLAYIAMEYLPGKTLRDIMNQGPMPLDLILDTITQMAEALAFAHEHGVIHRDIKPANVVITRQHGRIKLTDFGIAHLVNSNHTQTGQMLGSPRYMSPEQAMGRVIDGRSDIFSLGAVLYEMLTGQYAFDGESLPTIIYRVISEMPVPVEVVRPATPASLTQLLASMLSKNPEVRPDANMLVNSLHALATHAPALPPPPPQVDRISHPLRLLAFTTPVAVFLLVGVSIIVIEHFIDTPQEPQAPSALPGSVDLRGLQMSQAPQLWIEKSGGQAVPARAETDRLPFSDRPAPPADAYLEGLDKKQVELRIKRTELLLKYTKQHPDVRNVDRELEQLSTERRAYLKRQRTD